MTPPDPALLTECAETIKTSLQRAADMLIGQEAYLNELNSRHHGRLGRIEGVLPDIKNGLRVLLMIYRDGTPAGGFEKRVYYRPLSQVRFNDVVVG
jgi:hypothetical protein